MKRKFDVRKNMVCAFAAVGLAAGAFAEGALPQYCVDQSTQSKGWQYFLPDGTKTSAPSDWCDLLVTRTGSSNLALGGHLKLHSWTFDATNVTSASSVTGPWADADGTVTLGAGGVTMAANNGMRFGNKDGSVRVKLAESQTWSGPTTGTKWADFAIGCDAVWNGYYLYARMQALKDLVWTLDGRLRVSLCCSNDLSNVDVVVEPTARIVLVERYGQSTPASGRLHAKTLTLKGGDADDSVPLLTIGKTNPWNFAAGNNSTAPAAFDDDTLAPSVTLLDGASVTGGTVEYGLSQLSVSGGASTFSGDVTLVRPVTITVAEDASFAFTGSVKADEGAVLTVNGEGSFSLPSGTLDLPIAGTAELAMDPGKNVEVMLRGDLSGFTGTIRAKSGIVFIHPDARLNPLATCVADDGAVCKVFEASDRGDYSRDGCDFYRDSNGISHQYLYCNGFSKNCHLADVNFRTNRTDEGTVKWKNGSILVYDRTPLKGGITFSTTEAAGVIYEVASSGAQYMESTTFTLGELGMKAKAASQTTAFYMSNSKFHLSESQTWSGLEAAALSSSPFIIEAGGDATYAYNGTFVADKPGIEWTIEGDLLFQMLYPTNSIPTVDFRVKAPAMLHLWQFSSKLPGIGRLGARKLILDGGDSGIVFGTKLMGITNIGSPVEISPERIAGTIVLENGATLPSVQKTSWSGVTLEAKGADVTRVTGDYILEDEATYFTVDEGATLDLTEANFSVTNGVNARLVVRGGGTVRLLAEQMQTLPGGFDLSGVKLALVGETTWDRPLTGLSGFSVESDGLVYLTAAALEDYAGADIEIRGGTLVIDSAAAIPSGVKFVTEGTGALVLVDWTGFDKDAHMGGTQNTESPERIVTEEPIENEEVTVADGRTLAILGSGLGDSSSVTVEDGGKIRFYRTAMVAASVTLLGNAEITTEGESVVGTVAGKVTAPAATSSCVLALTSRGTLCFTGGGEFGTERHVKLCSGRVEISGKTFKTYGNLQMVGGWLKISDGGYWDCYYKTWTYVYLDQTQTEDATIEVAEGGTIRIGNSNFINIGKDPNHLSRLLVNGGTISRPIADNLFQINNGGAGNGVVEFNAGLIDTTRFLLCNNTTGSPQFIWRGGTIRVTGIYREFVRGQNLPVTVAGPDCVLDLSSYGYDVYSNCVGNAGITWRGEPGAKLAVKGSTSRDQVLRLYDFTPDGMAIDLNAAPRANVEIEGTGADVALGWATPGTTGTVTCFGTPSPLLANYFVPAGTTFENACMNDRWHVGFTSVVTQDLLFEKDATYLLRTTAEKTLPNLSLGGSLILPEALTYVVDQSLGHLSQPAEPLTVVTPAKGIEGACVWTCGGGISKKSSRVFVEDGVLKLDYKPTGALLFVR